MINRVLIRIKVVQMLYSYLLSRSEFRINPAPEAPSRDLRYAYSAYIDLLLLIVELSGYSVNSDGHVMGNCHQRLHDNRVAKAFATHDTLRNVILRGNSKVHLLDEVLPNLNARIQESAVFGEYNRKRKREIEDDVMLWITLLETIIAKDRAVGEALRRDPDFTNVGFEKAVEMVVDTLKSYSESRQLLTKTQHDLVTSLDKAYQLYLSLLHMIVELTAEQAERLDNAKNKYIVTSADRNPNTRLVDNALAAWLENNEQLSELMDQYKLNAQPWHPVLLTQLLDKILTSDIYKDYIARQVTDFETDVEFWREVMAKIIIPSDELAEELEDRSVYWNDDLEIMGTFVLKTLRRIAQSQGERVELLPKYKDAEDEAFGPELFMYSVQNYEQYRGYIDRFIDNSHWDPERMAFMDIVIMVAAIAELINYPKIPLPVTINEYIEIANHYSTEKSGAFINGILFSVVNYLNEQGIINKK